MTVQNFSIYVDGVKTLYTAEDANALKLSGGTMTGDIDGGGTQINGLKNATANGDVSNVGQFRDELCGHMKDIIAPGYSSSSTYDIGDLCIRNRMVYRCVWKITVPESWNALHWELLDNGAVGNRIDYSVRSLRSLAGLIRGDLTTWADIAYIVSHGNGPYVFPVGTQFTCTHSTLGTITWDVVGYDVLKKTGDAQAHTMALMSRDVLGKKDVNTTTPFILFPDGLPAGGYYFTYSGNSFSFTLPVDIPQGGYLRRKGTTGQSGNVEIPASLNMFDAAGNRISADIAITKGEAPAGSISIGSMDTRVGYDREITVEGIVYHGIKAPLYWSWLTRGTWPATGIRHWLNSDGESPAYDPYDELDIQPEWWTADGSAIPGFMYGLQPEFKSVLAKFDAHTRSHSQFELGDIYGDGITSGTNYVTSDWFALPSHNEVTPVQEGESRQSDGSALLEYYKDATDETRAKTNRSGVPYAWGLRTPTYNAQQTSLYVKDTGAIDSTNLNSSWPAGYAVLCCIG